MYAQNINPKHTLFTKGFIKDAVLSIQYGAQTATKESFKQGATEVADGCANLVFATTLHVVCTTNLHIRQAAKGLNHRIATPHILRYF